MEVIVKGEPKEIAALVVALQERQDMTVENENSMEVPLDGKIDLTALVDRGILTPNEVREWLGLGSISNGDERIIRRDYVSLEMMDMRDKEIQAHTANLIK
ncbi:MAG: hypothetical protein FWC13_05225 [Oscillospiraceae bacterium]|nr:hypothetical protein [Oscillospiraceae bacterium]